MSASKAVLRRALRERRRSLPDEHRAASATAVRDRIVGEGWLEGGQVASYFASDGELDPAPIGDAARRSGSTTWFPSVAGDDLQFIQWDGDSALVRGAFGIDEPAEGRRIDPAELDLVIVPLVGFDARGRRLGMGRGFYDRAFAFLEGSPGSRGPRLVGLAFDEQEVDAIVADAWDVPMDAIVTPTRTILIE